MSVKCLKWDTTNNEITEASAVAAADYSAKGKILVGTGAGTYTALTVGNDDEVLTADSGEASGVKWAAAGAATGLPTGTLIMWLTDTAPDGYLLCYGQSVSSVTYASLYAVIGTTFGGDGSPNFNLPDMRGRVPLGQDDMGGSSANVVTDAAADTIGGTDGHETHTLTTAELAAHTHGQNDSTSTGVQFNKVYNSAGSDSGAYGTQTSVGQSNKTIVQTDSAGSGTAHNNLQPYITVNYAIKT